MDAALLTSERFWRGVQPVAAGGGMPDLAGLEGLDGQVLFRSSGTTGEPKWVALSKDALQVSAAAVNAHLEVGRDSVWGLCLPVHHVGGFGVGARAWQAGCGFAVYPGKWDAGEWADWMAAARVTHSSLVPTQVHDVVRSGVRAPGTVRAIVVGGGRLEEWLGNEARALGWPVLASYGMTEAGSQIATQGLDALEAAYCAEPIPVLPVWEVRAGACLEISGGALFSGYVVRERGEWVFAKRAGDWFVTADRVEVSGAGLSPLGRADGVVKVLGELVDPEGIERELLELAGGRLTPGGCVVVAVDDERAGKRLVPVFEGGMVGMDEVLAHYQKSAPGFRRLADPVVVDVFPRSPLGKVRRSELARMLG